MTPAIETAGLTRYYGRRRGIEDLAIAVGEGEVFGFLGPNGAGKTTTIRMLLGFIRPTAGSATIFGRDAWADAPAAHRHLAYLSSEPGYLGELTAAQTLEFLCRIRGLPRNAWRALAERLELDPSIPIRKLSRGNRQKVGIVQVFMGDEPLLVMDEPTTGLDPLMQREFLELVGEVRSAGRTVFLSSHNLPEVERSCDRVAIVREGRLAEVRTVRELLSDHWRSINLVVSSPPPDGAFDLPNVRLLARAGQDVHLMVRGDIRPILRRIADLDVVDVAVTTPDIEDVFMSVYQAAPGRGGPPSAAAEASRSAVDTAAEAARHDAAIEAGSGSTKEARR